MMKIGDLVRYKGWRNYAGPFGIIVESSLSDSAWHSRIRVMWIGDPLPPQAKVLSVSGSRITSWVSPKHFDVVNSLEDHVNKTPM